MSRQSEAELENNLIKWLINQNYSRVIVNDEASLLSNLKSQLEAFNQTKFSQKEFESILNHLAKGNIFQKSQTLRGRFQLTKDDGETAYIQFFDSENTARNLYQVTNQVTQQGVYKNRYDVTLLVNGLPLVQIELKRSGIELKEAFNQICRYKRHTFWTNYSLFNYVQLFVISNKDNTKYYANNPLAALTFKQTFYWADENNKNITGLEDFTTAFLKPAHLGKMIAKYIVQNQTYKVLMALRPYQFYATEAIIKRVKESLESGENKNGYIWHTTGSGKTLTSFKASQILTHLAGVHKVVFVVDRKDLDYQTMKEFNSFKEGSVADVGKTATLVNQFNSPDNPLILTTIQKLNNAITQGRFVKQMESLANQKIVFIFDECHRSQFGDTHQRITNFFTNSQLFGFTGTPIFADNASKNDLGKRTTKDLFQKCLHKYVITDAIADQNVLRFNIEYIGKYKQKNNTFIDIEVEDIDTSEVFNDPARIEKIVDYILAYHNRKTHNKEFSALLATSSITNAMQYYDTFKRKITESGKDIRIATIFTYAANEKDEEAKGTLPATYGLEEATFQMAAEDKAVYKSSHTREKLDEYIEDYNKQFKTSFSTKDPKLFEGYFKDISKRLKEREKENFKDKDRLDIVIVVNMMLTGFDAKKVNTLYVDKNLKHHGLIQAYSRTNRILDEKKSQGNIVCFRNLKKSTDEAIKLFSNKDAKEEILLPDFNQVVKKFNIAYKNLTKAATTPIDVDDLISEDDQLAFVQAFRKILRLKNVLTSFVEFEWNQIDLEEEIFESYKSKYLDLKDRVKQNTTKEKESILNDIDFELELIQSDTINVAYILKLLADLKEEKGAKTLAEQKKAILDMLAGDVELRSKRELIEKFINEQLPHLTNVDDLETEFDKFWQDEKVIALSKICDEEELDKEQFKNLIDAYIYSEQKPLRDEVFKCLQHRPSILKARQIGERIITKMKEYVEVFYDGMVG